MISLLKSSDTAVAHQYQACFFIRLASVEMVTACFCDGTEINTSYFKGIDLHKELFMKEDCLRTI